MKIPGVVKGRRRGHVDTQSSSFSLDGHGVELTGKVEVAAIGKENMAHGVGFVYGVGISARSCADGVGL